VTAPRGVLSDPRGPPGAPQDQLFLAAR